MKYGLRPTGLVKPRRWRTILRVLAKVCATLVLAQLPMQVCRTAPLEDLQASYEVARRSGDLRAATLARVALAETRHPDALQTLLEGYTNPEPPTTQVRYLIAGIAARWFRGGSFASAYKRVRVLHDAPGDSWFWFRSLEAEGAGTEALAPEAVASNASTWLRSAALRALAETADTRFVDLAQRALAKVPSDPVDRHVLVAGLLSGVRSWRAPLTSPQKSVVLGLARLLDREETDEELKAVIARHLGTIFASESGATNSAAWLPHILGSCQDQPQHVDDVQTSSFYGIECTGMRIVYVLDVSSSMLAPLTAEELASIERDAGGLRPPGTAPSESPSGDAEPEAPARGGQRLHEELAAQDKATRFDAAKLFVQRSLSQLTASYRFAIVVFGTRAQVLTEGRLIRATAQNVARANEALAEVVCGEEPYGPATNLHAGIRLAYQLTTEGQVKGAAYASPEGIRRGASVLYVLTDGEPCVDDWSAPLDPMDLIHRPDSYETYWARHQLVEDVRRLNMFRTAEIHCVGFGVWDERLLRGIAEAGQGRTRFIGPLLNGLEVEGPGAEVVVDGHRRTVTTRREFDVKVDKGWDPCEDRPLRPETLGRLREMMRTASYVDRRRILQEVGCRGPAARAALPWLLSHLRTESVTAFEVYDTMLALSRMGRAVVPDLKEALCDEAVFVRQAAAGALGWMPGASSEDTVQSLVETLGDPNPEVRCQVAGALGRIGPGAASAVDALAKALGDEAHYVRGMSAWALGKIGPAACSALPALRAARSDPGEAVRASVQAAIAAIQGE